MKQFQLKNNQEVKFLTGAIKHMVHDLEAKQIRNAQQIHENEDIKEDILKAHNEIIDKVNIAKAMLANAQEL